MKVKNVLIVGASSGIGKATAEVLIGQGIRVFGTYHASQVTALHPQVIWQQWDASNPDFPEGFLPEVLDGFVYCPGTISLKPFHRMPAQDFLKDFDINVGGAIRALQSAHDHLKKAEKASILFFSTVAVQNGFSFHTKVAASKGAIEGLTRALSAEWAPKIRVNCIAPSITDTPLAAQLLSTDEKKEANANRHPLKKIGDANDIAQAAAFLLSDASSWITGQVLHVDGGIGVVR